MFKKLDRLESIFLHNNKLNQNQIEMYLEESVKQLTFINTNKEFVKDQTNDLIWAGENDLNKVVCI
jgi:hypothetical protein